MTAEGSQRSGRTILVIDDEPVLRMLTGDALRDAGYRVVEADNGRDGLLLLQSERIDLLITDVKLPGGVTGRQIGDLARLKQPRLPVLFMSGYAQDLLLKNGLVDAGTVVMGKPYSLREIVAKVETLLRIETAVSPRKEFASGAAD